MSKEKEPKASTSRDLTAETKFLMSETTEDEMARKATPVRPDEAPHPLIVPCGCSKCIYAVTGIKPAAPPTGQLPCACARCTGSRTCQVEEDSLVFSHTLAAETTEEQIARAGHKHIVPPGIVQPVEKDTAAVVTPAAPASTSGHAALEAHQIPNARVYWCMIDGKPSILFGF